MVKSLEVGPPERAVAGGGGSAGMQAPVESLSRRAARRALAGLYRCLPRPVYDALYAPAFSSYRALLRWRYRGTLRSAQRAGDVALARCRERVLEVMPFSLVGARGLEWTHELAQDLVGRGLDGAFVECGVAQGGCAALLARVAAAEGRGRPCWFFDSFEGLPEPTAEDFSDASPAKNGSGATGAHVRPLPRGSCLGTLEQVSTLLFERLGLARDSIHLVKGWFDQTLAPTRERIGPIALLRIDGDWYESTLCCFEALFDQVETGGAVIVDDYFSCHGARRATDTFLRRRELAVELRSDGRGGCFFRKP